MTSACARRPGAASQAIERVRKMLSHWVSENASYPAVAKIMHGYQLETPLFASAVMLYMKRIRFSDPWQRARTSLPHKHEMLTEQAEDICTLSMREAFQYAVHIHRKPWHIIMNQGNVPIHTLARERCPSRTSARLKRKVLLGT